MPHHSSILLTTLAYDMLNKLKKKFIRIFWQEGDKTSERFRLIDGYVVNKKKKMGFNEENNAEELIVSS